LAATSSHEKTLDRMITITSVLVCARLDRMATKKPVTTRWEITLIRQRGKVLGFVEATDEKAAIEEAIKVFQITEGWQQKRLVARRA
jgi:septum formation inhibitor-activating ATPase MinD